MPDSSIASSSAGPLQEDVAAKPVQVPSERVLATRGSALQKSSELGISLEEGLSTLGGTNEAGEASQVPVETNLPSARSQRTKKSRRNKKKAVDNDEASQETLSAGNTPAFSEASTQSSQAATRNNTHASGRWNGTARAEPRATFYPKFENEHAEQEVRRRMLQAVATGSGVLEVSLKHSGSLFMYAGPHYGAYAKNSWGNLYTAVGVFVLGRTFETAWGPEAAAKKQEEFNRYLESRHLVVAMELVTAVLGDHGQRPREDYVVVTAVADLSGKPRFMSTPDIVSFCRTWRLPNNNYWLLSTKEATLSFFTAYDCLCEEGTATSVQNVMNQMAEVAVPATWDHRDVQGEILEGLVARVVSPESAQRMAKITSQISAEAPGDTGKQLPLLKNQRKSLRQVCSENRASEVQQIKALLSEAGPAFCPQKGDWLLLPAGGQEKSSSTSKRGEADSVRSFLAAAPVDQNTKKLQDMVRMLNTRPWKVRFKCQHLPLSKEEHATVSERFRMTIHVLQDSVFRRYQNEMRANPELWPLYRGFFVDVSLAKKQEKSKSGEVVAAAAGAARGAEGGGGGGGEGEAAAEVSRLGDELHELTLEEQVADNDRHLMLKFKFLPYKIRTFLIRNGLPELFRKSKAEYLTYVNRQLKTWGISAAKAEEVAKMCKAWADHIQGKRGSRMPYSSTYLDEAEVFLAQYMQMGGVAERSLVGHAGAPNLIDVSSFIMQQGRDPRTAEGEEKEENGEGEREREGGAAAAAVVMAGPKGEASSTHKKKPTDGPAAAAAAAAAASALAPSSSSNNNAQQQQARRGALIFFPGIPGCAKSALSAELESRLASSSSAAGFPVTSLMGDRIKGRYWKLLGDSRKRNPKTITIADKNAPNRDVWVQICDICSRSRARAIPVLVDSPGTPSNPFCLTSLAIFLWRVLQRQNHPGALDKSSPNAGFVLLMFYNLYEGNTRAELEDEMWRRFGALVKQPLLREDAGPLPEPIRTTLEEGRVLYRRHSAAHGRADSASTPLAGAWADWEKRMRETLSAHEAQLIAMQVPFAEAVESVVAQVEAVLRGECVTPEPHSSSSAIISTHGSTGTGTGTGSVAGGGGGGAGGSIVYAAIVLAPADVHAALKQLSAQYPAAADFFATRPPNKMEGAHVTLAHKREHGVAAVASFAALQGTRVAVQLTALVFSELASAAWEVHWADQDKQRGVMSHNAWPHITVWTAAGVPAKEASNLPVLANAGQARQIRLAQPILLHGHLELIRR